MRIPYTLTLTSVFEAFFRVKDSSESVYYKTGQRPARLSVSVLIIFLVSVSVSKIHIFLVSVSVSVSNIRD